MSDGAFLCWAAMTVEFVYFSLRVMLSVMALVVFTFVLLLLLCVFYFIFFSFFCCSRLTGPLTHVTSVVKGKTDLPCDITPPVENDQASLVLFYKDDASPSIYT